MEFGLFSNGFRPHTTAQQAYAADIREIVFADRLGFNYAFISEHHGEQIYINKVDTLPIPELLMCKAAALTKQIRMGAAVNILHLHHPLDIAMKTATTDQVIGDNRFIFGFGSGFPNPLLATARGLAYETRKERVMEALQLIEKCWASDAPFDWDGPHWPGKGILCWPKPINGTSIPMAIATDTPDMMAYAGKRGMMPLSAYFETAPFLRRKADIYARAAAAAGHQAPLRKFTVARLVYLAERRQEAMDDLRPAINNELSYQKRRGIVNVMRRNLGLEVPDDVNFDDMVENGTYLVGEPDAIGKRLREFYDATGGFGVLLLLAGKEWATAEKRERSMQLFADHIAPVLRPLDPTRLPDAVPA